MKFLSRLSCKVLYLLWALMFVLTAFLGILFPNVTEVGARIPLMLAACLFFLPPWAIVKKGEKKHSLIVRLLARISLVVTCVMLCLNLSAPAMNPELGDVLNLALTILSAPMVCSNFFALPLFLWGCLLMGTFGKK